MKKTIVLVVLLMCSLVSATEEWMMGNSVVIVNGVEEWSMGTSVVVFEPSAAPAEVGYIINIITGSLPYWLPIWLIGSLALASKYGRKAA